VRHRAARLDESSQNAGLPLTPDTHHLIDAARLERMKEGAFLVNVSRGGIVDTFSSTASLAELGRRAAEEAVRLSGQQPLHLCNNID